MRIALGTVQFGQPYGVADDGGPPAAGEIARILSAAWDGGVRIIDTAPLYGPCERLLGEAPGGIGGFRIVTKTGHFANAAELAHSVRGVRATFERSLRDLRCGRVAGLLIHNPRDALSPWSDDLVDIMMALRAEGRVEKIGLSVYEPSDLDSFRRLRDIDLVQLPLNVLDQRMAASGWLSRLRALGIEVHARSAFLQGLLCMDPAAIPGKLAAATPVLRRFHDARRAAGLSAPAACMAFLAATPGVDAVVVGAKTLAQFAEVLSAATAAWATDFSRYAVEDPAIIDPRRWAA